jgi:hypothetical protein
LKEKNNYQATAQEKQSIVQPRPTQKKQEIKPTNVFAALDSSDEESDEETKVSNVVIKEEFPALGGAKLSVQEATKPAAFSYANALATEKPKPVVARPIPQIVLKSRWVDAVSSDEEDEDEEDEYKNKVYEDNSAW